MEEEKNNIVPEEYYFRIYDEIVESHFLEDMKNKLLEESSKGNLELDLVFRYLRYKVSFFLSLGLIGSTYKIINDLQTIKMKLEKKPHYFWTTEVIEYHLFDSLEIILYYQGKYKDLQREYLNDKARFESSLDANSYLNEC